MSIREHDINIRDIARPIAGACFDLIAEKYVSQKATYLDPVSNRPIVSIGMHRETGNIRAAFDDRFLAHPDYVCVWMR